MLSRARYNGARHSTKYTTAYSEFRGVDFSTPSNEVDARRSPDALNVMVNNKGVLTKRPGVRCVWHTSSGETVTRINGIHRFVFEGRERIIIHAGNKMFLYRGTDIYSTPTDLIYTGCSNTPSTSVVCRGKLLILTGGEYLVYDGKAMYTAKSKAHIPTVLVACDPATGSGTTLESVNLLTNWRIATYTGDGSTKTFALVERFVYDQSSDMKVTVDGITATITSVDYGHKKITLATAPASGDEVKIQYWVRPASGSNVDIDRCRFMGVYGLGGSDSDRVFFSGDPENPNVDWHCDISYPKYNVDPFYIPDTSFAYIGIDSCAVLGYRRLGNYQVIIKEENTQDASVFLRNGNLDEDGEAIFNIHQGAAGIGAKNPYAVATLGDEPVFLSKSNGICGITNSAITNVTNINNRSWYIDGRLLDEKYIDNATACTFDGMYLLATNNSIYVLDSMQNRSYKEHASSYVYESYYWEVDKGLELTSICATDNTVFVGCDDGSVLRFKFDSPVPEDRFVDDYYNESKPILAYWCTPFDGDNYESRLKTVSAFNLAVCPTDTAQSLTVMYRRDEEGDDGYIGDQIHRKNLNLINGLPTVENVTRDFSNWHRLIHVAPSGMFSFGAMSFAHLTFAHKRIESSIPNVSKIKHYKRLQLCVINDVLGENINLGKILKSFSFDDFNKKYTYTPE